MNIVSTLFLYSVSAAAAAAVHFVLSLFQFANRILTAMERNKAIQANNSNNNMTQAKKENIWIEWS